MVEHKNSSLSAVREFNGEARPHTHSDALLESNREVQPGEAQRLLCNKEIMGSMAQQSFTSRAQLIPPINVNAGNGE